MGFLHCSICPPYVELKKIVEYQPGTNTMGETPWRYKNAAAFVC